MIKIDLAESASGKRQNLAELYGNLAPSVPQITALSDAVAKLVTPSIVPSLTKIISDGALGIAISKMQSDFNSTLQASIQRTIESSGVSALSIIQNQISESLIITGSGLSKSLVDLQIYQLTLLQDIGTVANQLKTASYPENIRNSHNVRFRKLTRVLMEESIALYGVPSTRVTTALLGAENPEKRRAILGREWKSISWPTGQSTLQNVNKAKLRQFTGKCDKAWQALDSGHAEAAQALAASIIDSLTYHEFESDRAHLVPGRHGSTASYDELKIHEYLATAPLWGIYEQYWPNRGDPIPRTFNRHATAHTVSSRQYTKRNAVQGLLFATSFLLFLNSHGSISREFRSDRRAS